MQELAKRNDSYYRQNTTAVVLSRLLTKNNAAINELDMNGNDKYLLLNNYYYLESGEMIEKIKDKSSKYLNKQ